MFLVVDVNTLSVHGLDKPCRVSDVGDGEFRFCIEESRVEEDVRDLKVSVEFAWDGGDEEGSGRLAAVGPGPAADEFEMMVRFKRPGRRVAEALEILKDAFEKKYAFLGGREGGTEEPGGALSMLGGMTGEVLRDELDEAGFSKALADTLGLPFVDLEVSGVDVLQARDFTRDFLLEHLALPVGKQRKEVLVAVGRFPSPRAVAAFGRKYGEKVRYAVAPASQIVSGVETAYEIRSNRRRAARLSVALRLRLGAYDENWGLEAGPVDGTTRNISPGGLLAVTQPLAGEPKDMVGKRAGVLVYLPEYEAPLRAAGRIVRAKRVAGSGANLHSYALELNYMPNEDRRKLDVFRYTLLWGPRRLRVEE